jgi:hypothetical protein
VRALVVGRPVGKPITAIQFCKLIQVVNRVLRAEAISRWCEAEETAAESEHFRSISITVNGEELHEIVARLILIIRIIQS